MLSLLRRFGYDRRGNFSIVVGIGSVPLVLAVGMALDLAAIARCRSNLQSALDIAALSLARQGSTITDAAAYQTADEYLQANFKGSYSGLKVQRVDTAFTVSADALADTVFDGLFGNKTRTVFGKSTAEMGDTRYEIALVLDTTGSMAGPKLQAMKDAVLGMINSMSTDVKVPANLKFSLVPFAQFVNVGPQYAPQIKPDGKVDNKTGARWLDIEGKSNVAQLELKKDVSRFAVFHNLGVQWAGCVETRQPTSKVAYDVTDAPRSKEPESLFVPALSIDEPDTGPYQNSYITSTVNPLDKSTLEETRKLLKYGVVEVVDPLTGGVGTELVPVEASITQAKGPNSGCTTQPIMPLTTNYQAIINQVNALQAAGNTNIMEGVAWGWRVLSPGEPFTEGAAKSTKTQKLMILLTDGSNVFGVRPNALGSSYTSYGFAADQRLMTGVMTASSTNESMNAKTLATCTNAKADGIEIFTIKLQEPNAATGTMLKACATDEGHYFDTPSHTKLDEVFSKIREKLTRVRTTS